MRQRSDNVRDYVVKGAVQPLGLKVVRADEMQEPGQITRQIIEHVLHAKLAIGDLTGANPNVFYELGVRHAAGLPVVLIAEEDEISRLPFDLIDMRVIGFRHDDLRSVDSAKEQIAAQTRAALDGAVDSPVGTVRALESLSRGTDVEQALASLSRTLDLLTRSALDTNITVKRLANPPSRSYELDSRPDGTWVLRFETTDGRERIELPVKPTQEETADLVTAAQERANSWWSGEAVEDPDAGALVATAENVVRARILERAESESKGNSAVDD